MGFGEFIPAYGCVMKCLGRMDVDGRLGREMGAMAEKQVPESCSPSALVWEHWASQEIPVMSCDLASRF